MATPITRAKFTRWPIAAIAILAVCAAIILIARRQAASSVPLRIGINSWPAYEFLHLAKVEGLYDSEGVEVEIIEFNSLLDARRAFERGQIDGLGTTAIDMVLTLGQTMRSPRIVQAIDYSEGGDQILVDSAIQGIEGLRGKRVGLEFGTVGSYLLTRALSIHGMAYSDIVATPSDQISMTTALRERELEAVVTYPPFSRKILSAGGAKEAFSSASIPGEVVDVIAFDRSIVDDRPEDVVRVLRAYWKARELVRTAPATSIPVMARREGVSDAEFAASLKDGIHLLEPADQPGYLSPGGLLERVVQLSDSILRREKAIEGPVRTDSVVDRRFIPPPAGPASK